VRFSAATTAERLLPAPLVLRVRPRLIRIDATLLAGMAIFVPASHAQEAH
jgi:hypothetical protein